MQENYYSVFKRDGYYYYYVYDKYGIRRKRSTGIKVNRGNKGKQELRALLFKRETEGTLIEPKNWSRTKFSEIATDFWNYDTCPYIQEKKALGGDFSEHTAAKNMTQVRKYMNPEFGNKMFVELSAKYLKAWFMSLPKKYNIGNHTANQCLFNLRHILDYAVEQEIIEKNPAKQIKQFVVHNENKEIFKKEQIQALFAEKWDYDNPLPYTACYLAAFTGMRIGEIRALTVEQVHTNYIQVNASWASKRGRKCTKNTRGRIVPISSKIYWMLKKIAPEKGLIFTYNGFKPMGDSSITHPLYKRMEEIGIDRKKEKLSFHSFRYYANTCMKAAGVPEIMVRAVLGHQTQVASEIYDQLYADDLGQVLTVMMNAM